MSQVPPPISQRKRIPASLATVRSYEEKKEWALKHIFHKRNEGKGILKHAIFEWHLRVNQCFLAVLWDWCVVQDASVAHAARRNTAFVRCLVEDNSPKELSDQVHFLILSCVGTSEECRGRLQSYLDPRFNDFENELAMADHFTNAAVGNVHWTDSVIPPAIEPLRLTRAVFYHTFFEC
jgi:hypothetical protein